MPKHKVFVSYHHANDQVYKEALLALNRRYDLFIDASVDIGDIDDSLDDHAIRRIIRDDFLRDATVTILLVGTETRFRKHIDWELYSSMYNGAVNKQSGILVIQLPSTNPTYFTAAHGDTEKSTIYPENVSWTSISERARYEERYPFLPARIIDNLLAPQAKISVVSWSKIESDPEKLRYLINATFDDRMSCDYDMSRPMRRKNY